MHGGARGSGAPVGNRNALVHGYRGAGAVAERRRAREVLRALRELAAALR